MTSNSETSSLESLDLDLADLLAGVPIRLGFVATPVSDFLGRPRARFIGVYVSASLRGTVVVLVLVTRLMLGD